MGLVNELQEIATKEDVLAVLRKAAQVAAKLKLTNVASWINHERYGYDDMTTIPNYRILNGRVIANTIIGVIDTGNQCKGIPIKQSMSSILSLISSSNDGFVCIDISPELAPHLYAGVLPHQKTTFHIKVNQAVFKSIPETVKDKVLDWALELEQQGILGEEQTFKDTEIEKANSVQLNITNCSIDQLNNMGQNIKEKE